MLQRSGVLFLFGREEISSTSIIWGHGQTVSWMFVANKLLSARLLRSAADQFENQ